MKWSVVPYMHLKPYRCIACGSTPRDDQVEGKPNKQAYFAEGIDVNWGDSLFLCDSCVRVLGELRGMVDVEDHERLQRKYDSLVEQHNALAEAHEKQDARIERMLDGVKAKKEVQQTRTKRSVRKEAVDA